MKYLDSKCSVVNGFRVEGKPVKVSKSPKKLALGCRIYVHFFISFSLFGNGENFFVVLWTTSNNLHIYGLVFALK